MLTLLAAVIGLITVIVDHADSSGESPAPVTSTFTEPDQGGGEGGESEGPTGSGDDATPQGEATLDPSHDGNSRSSAKELTANQPVISSLAAANDLDWYVYRAPKEETAEVVSVDGEMGSEILSVALFEGVEEVAHSADASTFEPL